MVRRSCISWDITPCNPLKFNRRFGSISLPFSVPKRKLTIYLLAACFMLDCCLAYHSILMMDETSDCTPLYPKCLHSHCCENFKFNVVKDGFSIDCKIRYLFIHNDRSCVKLECTRTYHFIPSQFPTKLHAPITNLSILIGFVKLKVLSYARCSGNSWIIIAFFLLSFENVFLKMQDVNKVEKHLKTLILF
jgi:hypothetical protein